MDPITHGLIGAALSALSGHPLQLSDPVFLGCTLGGMLPDLDIVTHVKGRLNYLLKHRGASHSVLALGCMALSLSAVLYALFPSTPWAITFIWTLIGTLSHGITDILNSYGAELLWPFWRKKITVDMVILTDPVICCFFLTSLIVSVINPSLAAKTTLTALAAAAVYLAVREMRKRKVKNKLADQYRIADKKRIKVIPAMYKPFSWNFIINQPGVVCYGTFKKGKARVMKILPDWDEKDPHIVEALNGNLADIFTQFTPYYHLVVRPYGENGWEVDFIDLRYWTKEHFLYSGQVLLDESGEISKETFSLPNRENVILSY